MAVRSADVVVIGGGANGASTAFHLASLGVRRIVLLERRHLAAGASGKSGALVRMHYTNEGEARLALESLKVFRNFDAAVGGDCGFEPVGFVQIVPRGYEETLRRNVAMQQDVGIETDIIGQEDLARLLPGGSFDDVGEAAWEPGSGFADPNATTYAFAEAARRLGATVETGCEVTRVVVEGGRAVAVDTSLGRIATPVVVLVAGAWAGRLLSPLGLDFGLVPHRVQVAIFRWPPGLGRRHPAVIDAVHRSWFRPEGRAATLIGVELGLAHADPDDFDEGVDRTYVDRARKTLAARWPPFGEAVMRGGWAGMIMMSPDGRPIIDRLPGVDGLWGMLGDSGTSFKTSPAIGRCLAEWIVHGSPRTVDLAPFRATRFAEGSVLPDPHSYGGGRLTVTR